jgi:hypothetical protein
MVLLTFGVKFTPKKKQNKPYHSYQDHIYSTGASSEPHLTVSCCLVISEEERILATNEDPRLKTDITPLILCARLLLIVEEDLKEELS